MGGGQSLRSPSGSDTGSQIALDKSRKGSLPPKLPMPSHEELEARFLKVLVCFSFRFDWSRFKYCPSCNRMLIISFTFFTYFSLDHWNFWKVRHHALMSCLNFRANWASQLIPGKGKYGLQKELGLASTGRLSEQVARTGQFKSLKTYQRYNRQNKWDQFTLAPVECRT